MLPLQIGLQFLHLGVCTKLLSQFINKLPFLLQLDAYDRFVNFKSAYESFHRDCEAFNLGIGGKEAGPDHLIFNKINQTE